MGTGGGDARSLRLSRRLLFIAFTAWACRITSDVRKDGSEGPSHRELVSETVGTTRTGRAVVRQRPLTRTVAHSAILLVHKRREERWIEENVLDRY